MNMFGFFVGKYIFFLLICVTCKIILRHKVVFTHE